MRTVAYVIILYGYARARMYLHSLSECKLHTCPAGYRGRSIAQAVGRHIIMIKNKFGIRAGEVRTIIGENKTGQDHYKMVLYTIYY